MDLQTSGPVERLLRFDDLRTVGPFDQWWEDTSAFFAANPLQSPANKGRYITNGFFCERAMMVDTQYDSVSLDVTARHSSMVGNFLMVQRNLYGSSVGRRGDDPVFHRCGDVSIIDFASQFQCLHETSGIQCVYVFKSELGLDPSAPLPHRHFEAASPMAQLLNAEMDRIFNPLMSGRRAFSNAILDRFLACVRVAILGRRDYSDVRLQARDALRDLICDFIERNLESETLSTQTLLAQFGVSRASLYRMFEHEGGVRNYITNRRLFRAVFQISTNPMSRGQIYQAAEKWGFSSAANFSRSVRREFGATPGSLFEAPFRNLLRPIITPQLHKLVTETGAAPDLIEALAA